MNEVRENRKRDLEADEVSVIMIFACKGIWFCFGDNEETNKKIVVELNDSSRKVESHKICNWNLSYFTNHSFILCSVS